MTTGAFVRVRSKVCVRLPHFRTERERIGHPALSWGDVRLVAPAAASLTFIGNAVAAKIFLHERVDRRRWIAASLLAAGVALLAG